MSESIDVSAEPAGMIDDPVLDALSDEADAEADLFAPMGAEEPQPRDENPNRTYNLSLAPPTAIDLRRLLERAGGSALSLTEAFAGLPTAILLCHTMTPFAIAGERPVPIWGMGYQVELVGVERARTVSLVPASEIATAASVSVSAGISLTAGAELGTPLGALQAILPLPLPDASLKASADGQIRLELPEFKLQAVRVISGPIGAGGAMWQLYRQREVLNVSQLLLHVLALPAGVEELTLRLTAWVSRRGWFGMRAENRIWRTPAQDIKVAIAASPQPGP